MFFGPFGGYGDGTTPSREDKDREKDPPPVGGIFDQECPACKVRGAYIGFNTVECHNSHCVHWSPRWHLDYQKLLSEAATRQKEVKKQAKSLLTEEFGLDWGPNEEITKDSLDAPFFAFGVKP